MTQAENDRAGNAAQQGWVFRNASWILGAVFVAAAGVFFFGLYRDQARDAFKWASQGSELLILAAGLFSILLIRNQLVAQERQLSANRQQLIDDHKWRTYISYHEHFDQVPPDRLREEMYQLATNLGFIHHFDDLGREMPQSAFEACKSDANHWRIVRPYLDSFEEFCGAINAGIVNEDYAYSLQATRVIRNFTVFQRLIRHYQLATGTAYVELEKVATRWSIKANLARAARAESIGVGAGTSTRIHCPS